MIKIYILLGILLFFIFSKKKEHINFNAQYMIKEYSKYNLEYDKKNKIFTHQPTQKKLSTLGQFNSRISSHISNNKEKTLKKLQNNDIPVTKFYLWNKDASNSDNLENIKKLEIKYPVVAKPTNGTQGRDVMTDIKDKYELIDKISKFRENDNILVEEQLIGKNYRILVFNRKIIDVIERIPPIVIGNGISTLEKLIELYGISQKEKDFFEVYNYDTNLIKSQGYNINDIIPKNKEILLTKTVNFHNGSQIKRINITKIHPLNIGMFIKTNDVLNLDLSGIDYMTNSIEDPYYMHGAVIEVNDGPDMKIHYVADKNQKKFALNKFLKIVEQVIK